MNSNQNNVNNSVSKAIDSANDVISKFNTLRDSINKKITDINNLINIIPQSDNKPLSNDPEVTKTIIAEYFINLVSKKKEIDDGLIDLKSQSQNINNFILEKDKVIEELKVAAKKISAKREVINASVDNNNAKNAALSEKMDNIQSKKSRVIDLGVGIKKLQFNINDASIEKINKKLNTKFIQLRYDLRNKIVTYYETLSGTNSGLLNAKVTEYKNELSDTVKISILTEISKMINKMLKYVIFCKEQIENKNLGNIIVDPLNNQASNENKKYNKTNNLLDKIIVLEKNLNDYKTELSKLRKRLKENFEKDLNELTEKIRNAINDLKECIGKYKEEFIFSSKNKTKVAKHNLQYMEENTVKMGLNINEVTKTLNTMSSTQNAKSKAKLDEIIAKLDALLGSNSSESLNNRSVSTNSTSLFNSKTPKSNFEKNKIIKWNPSKNIIMEGKVESGNVIKGKNLKNRIHLVNVIDKKGNMPQSPVNFNIKKYEKGNNGVYKLRSPP